MRVLLIDGSNYIHRGHWAIAGQKGKERLETQDGFPTSGIKGMLNIILADISVLRPDCIVVCYDVRGATWRHIEYPEYKKSPGRVAAKVKAKDSGNNVYVQIKPVQRILKAMGIKQIGVVGEEADDIIGTLSVMFSSDGHEVLIASNDKDFGSLVNKQVKMVESVTRRLLGIKGILDKYGVKPSKMVEYLMLQGDAVDNIPGVVRCGGTTAAKLLNTHGSIRQILANVDTLTPSLKANVVAARSVFKWTRRLITIKTTVEHKITVANSGFRTPNYETLEALCRELELVELHKKIVQMLKEKHQWK